jgi:hypothetical protein
MDSPFLAGCACTEGIKLASETAAQRRRGEGRLFTAKTPAPSVNRSDACFLMHKYNG